MLFALALSGQYSQPYHLNFAKSNPSIEEVKTVVVDGNIRPTWKADVNVSLGSANHIIELFLFY